MYHGIPIKHNTFIYFFRIVYQSLFLGSVDFATTYFGMFSVHGRVKVVRKFTVEVFEICVFERRRHF